MKNLFNAGTETTSTTVRWAILFLILHPDVQQRMYEEIGNVLGESELLSMEFKTRLPYCEAVITEVQRLGDIAPLSVPHSVRYDVNWNDYVIPKGSIVLMNLTSVAMDPEIFPEPEKFLPGRFLDSNGKFSYQKKIFPFSLGKCVLEIDINLFYSNVKMFSFGKKNHYSNT